MSVRDLSASDSYYQVTRNRRVDAAPLSGGARAEVAVIGGGLSGAAAALNLARQGVEVALLEAREFGWGASGRSGGQVICGYSCGQEAIEGLVGRERAQALWRHARDAVDYTCELIREHAIDCDYRRGYLHVAGRPSQMRALARQTEHLQRDYACGPFLRVLSRAELQEELLSPVYSGGVMNELNGHVHPLNYCLGICAAAARAGAALYAESPVTQIERRAAGFRLHGESFTLDCRELVYACNAYLDDLAPRLQRFILPVGSYIIATEPLPEAGRLIRAGRAVADNSFLVDYYRMSADNRLLFGGRISHTPRPPRDMHRSLRARMTRVFPQLADARIDYAWGGLVAITRNRAPHIGRRADGSWFLHGFSGKGMALSTYAGKLVAGAINGDAEPLADFAAIPHRRFPAGRWLRAPMLLAAAGYYRLRDRLA